MSDEGDTDRDRLLAAAALVRATLEGTRSDRLLRLFEYLLEKSLADEATSEQQIAAEVFNDDRSADSGSDANVRVYIHRLRKIMESAFAGTSAARLYLPVGEYRLRLDKADGPRVVSDGSATKAPLASRPGIRRARAFVPVAVLLAALGLAWILTDRREEPLTETVAWQAIATGNRPITVVVGDYYLFAQIDRSPAAKDKPPQLVFDRSVPTREELIILQMLDAGKANAVIDYNQQYVSGGTIEALSMVRSGFAHLPSLANRQVRLVAASQLTPELLASTDLIYVGQFSGMAQLLRDPLAQASGFAFDPGFGGLTDRKSATKYWSDGMTLTDERISKRDFAYLANLPGPAGNRILLIAGIGDAGVKEAARIAMNPDEMKRLELDSSRLTNGFEALYRVRTIKNVNVGAAIIIDRPLRSGGIWDNSGNVPAYRPFDVEPNASPQR